MTLYQQLKCTLAMEIKEKKKKKKKKKNTDNLGKLLLHTNYIKILLGVNFHSDLHFDVKMKIGISLSIVE